MVPCMIIEDAADGLYLPASSRRSACPMAGSPGQTVRQVRMRPLLSTALLP